MKSVKPINISGSMSSFVPTLQKATPEPNQAEPVEIKKTKEIDFKEVLSQMPKEQAKSMMADLFSAELSQLEQQVVEESKAAGLEQAKIESETKLNKQVEELAQLINDWTTMLEKAKSLEGWKIEDEDNFKSLVFLATTKLIGKELSSESYSNEFFTSLVADYAEHSPKALHLSPLQAEHLRKLTKSSWMHENFQLIEDEQMLPGSYKLTLSSGTLEFNLDQAMQEFKCGLLPSIGDEQ